MHADSTQLIDRQLYKAAVAGPKQLALFEDTDLQLADRASSWAYQHPEYLLSDNQGIGCSGVTPGKHHYVPQLVKMILDMSSKPVRNGAPLVYIEPYAGSGLYLNKGLLTIGSPLLALDVMDSHKLFSDRSNHYDVFLCEKKKKFADLLKLHILGMELGKSARSINIVRDVCQLSVPKIANLLINSTRGILFVDPNGMLPKALHEWSHFQTLSQVDFVLWVDRGIPKRFQGLTDPDHSRWKFALKNGDCRPLRQIIDGINKQKWIIRKPFSVSGKARTIIIGTNWKMFPIWTAGGWVDISTLEGQSILSEF